MALKKKTISLVVFLIVTALVGLIVVQVYLLYDAFELKEQAFRQNVAGALGVTSVRLATGETMANAFRIETKVKKPPHIAGNSFTYRITSPQRVRLQRYDSTGMETVIVDTIKEPGEHTVTFQSTPREKGAYYYRFNTDNDSMVVHVIDGLPAHVLRPPANKKERDVLVSRVIDNLWVSDRQPIERRINPSTLDSVLRRSMRESGIPLDFSYGVITPHSDSVRLASPANAADQLRTSDFRAPLLLAEGPSAPAELVVYFPEQSLYLLRQIWPVALASVLFVGLIAFGFLHTIRTIIRQQRLSGLMVDFINNMTHEFKTPISTVVLASEAIRRPDVVSRKTKVLRYNKMIEVETLRMKKQVDRILQMAQLEEGDIELTVTDVDMHELIQSAADNFVLQVETRGGRITLDLKASSRVVRGDAMHLANIIHNLLDNANKYSPGAPAISIATENVNSSLVIRMSDRGAGIAEEHRKKVFEKYYRVPMGNVHNVKGFGIGLSYVRLLVESHGGTITLNSEPGLGTEVILVFPVRPGKPASDNNDSSRIL